MTTETDEQINAIARIYEQQRPRLAEENTHTACQLIELADRLANEILSDEYDDTAMDTLRDATGIVLDNARYHVARARAFSVDDSQSAALGDVESEIGKIRQMVARY